MKLLDSNTVVHYLQGRQAVVARVHEASKRELLLPSVVVYELQYGTLKKGSPRRRAMMEQILAELDQAPFDAAAAIEAARIRFDLERRGLKIGPLDLMIAATAVTIGAILVTNNTREFARVKELRLEDWTV